MDRERDEFKTGYEVPDLTDGLVVKNLKSWNGTPGGLNTIKFIKISKNEG
jgi:translation machinery-associated protein 16